MPPHECLIANQQDERAGINTASGEGTIRRSASGLQREPFSGRRVFLKFRNAADHFPAEGRHSRLRVSPLRRRYGAAAIVVTTACIMNRKPRRVRDRAPMARTRRRAHTAGMRFLRRGRQRQRDKVPHQHEQQQKSGSQAMHGFRSTGLRPGYREVGPA